MDKLAEVAAIFVKGAVTIGIITALFLPGRQTTAVTQTVVNGATKLYSTGVTGK